MAHTEFTSANVLTEWVPERMLADVLAGDVVADCGQVRGLWKKTLDAEVKAGRLTTWKGHWFPVAGAPYGIGPLKTCYGTPEVAEGFKTLKASLATA